MNLQRLGIALLIGCAAGVNFAEQPLWQRSTRVQLALEQDNNIKESPTQPEGAPSLRFLLHCRGQGQHGKTAADFSLQLVCQGYWQHLEENKAVGELAAGGTWFASQRWSLGGRGSLRLKTFLNGGLTYLASTVTAFAHTQLPAKISATASLSGESLDYSGSSEYDSQGWGAELVLSRPVAAWLRVGATMGGQQGSLDRPAYTYDRATDRWSTLPDRHRDRSFHGGARLEVHRRGQWAIAYLYERTSSNSYGYGFLRHKVSLLGAVRLHEKVLLRLYGLLQRKRYAEEVGPTVPMGLDTEREQSNVLVVDFSRPLSARLTAILRLAWYDNESLVRGWYYEKSTMSLSLERRF
ncbi:MAG: hypothetical protein QHJ34_15865 [bacterium]|jgi:hypothetical protein|nr:hypothetical protein [candidate division KSB1 bacterium]MDH7561679.1 hypothetical protein [bacterium]